MCIFLETPWCFTAQKVVKSIWYVTRIPLLQSRVYKVCKSNVKYFYFVTKFSVGVTAHRLWRSRLMNIVAYTLYEIPIWCSVAILSMFNMMTIEAQNIIHAHVFEKMSRNSSHIYDNILILYDMMSLQCIYMERNIHIDLSICTRRHHRSCFKYFLITGTFNENETLGYAFDRI